MQGHFIALGSEDVSGIEVGLELRALHFPLLSGFLWKTQCVSSAGRAGKPVFVFNPSLYGGCPLPPLFLFCFLLGSEEIKPQLK